MPKTQEKIDIAIIKEQIIMNSKEHQEIKEMVSSLSLKMDKVIEEKANKEDFIFWRNILISGLIISIFIGIFTLILDKYIK